VQSMVTGRLRVHSSPTCTFEFVFVPIIRRKKILYFLFYEAGILQGTSKLWLQPVSRCGGCSSIYTVGIVT